MSDFVFSTTMSNGNTDVYATDGTSAGTVDLGLNLAKQTEDFTQFNNDLFFVGTLPLGTGPAEGSLEPVFSTDGTQAGTQAVQLNGGVVYPDSLNVVDGKLLATGVGFTGNEGIYATSDGVNFTTINSSVQSSNGFFVSNGLGFFDASSDTTQPSNVGLWRTDGTDAGTYAINPGNLILNPVSFASAGAGLTAFVNDDGTLWVTNGTGSGTRQITNAALGTKLNTSIPMVSVGGKAYFAAISAAGEYSVWGTDGTSAGTVQVFDGGYAYGQTRPITGIAPFGDKLIITSGYGSYVYNGTTTINLPLVVVGADNNVPQSFVVAGDKLFLAGPSDNGISYPLYVSDGTAAGTAQVNIPGLVNINGSLTAVGNDVVFEGTDTTGHQALFETDGTAAGSRELALPAGATVDPDTTIAALPAVPMVTPPPTVPGGSGVVTLGGGAQNYSAAAGATVLAGSGNDTITANAGGVLVVASVGTLAFLNGSGPSTVSGGAGSATIFGGTGGGNYAGGSAGHNVLVAQGAARANTTLTGAAAGDQLFGSANGNDVLIAGVGRESVLGGGGLTTIEGGAAASVIFTGSGITSVVGGTAGGDTIVGGSGTGRSGAGGSGVLTVTAQKGDAIFGNAGALNVTGSTGGADSIVGGSGPLNVSGRGGNMLVVASTSLSDINTGTGAALVFAGSGTSNIVGGAGSLQVVLGAGITNIAEGSGPSTYDLVKGAAGGTDVIGGFKVGTDQIQSFGYASGPHVTTIAGGTLLSFGDGTHIELLGITGSLGHSLVG